MGRPALKCFGEAFHTDRRNVSVYTLTILASVRNAGSVNHRQRRRRAPGDPTPVRSDFVRL